MNSLFISGRMMGLVTLLLLLIALLYAMNQSEKREKPFGSMRPLAAMEHIDESVGRAAEMGTHVHATPGQGNLYGPKAAICMAAISVVGLVAESCAKRNVPLVVSCNKSIVYQVTAATVRDAYDRAGYPERFDEDSVIFVSPDWNAWCQWIMDHLMVTKPATNIMFGDYYGQIVLLAESGVRAGCFQIAGSPGIQYMWPLSCDYFTIGEELYAAGAYASGDPILLGSIAGQDILKFILLAIMALGILTNLAGSNIITTLLSI